MNKRLSFVLLVGVAMLLLTAVAGWLRRSPPSPVSALAPSAKPASKPGAALPPNAGSPPLQAFASGYVASLARELRTELANDHPDLLPALDALTRPDVGASATASGRRFSIASAPTSTPARKRFKRSGSPKSRAWCL